MSPLVGKAMKKINIHWKLKDTRMQEKESITGVQYVQKIPSL